MNPNFSISPISSADLRVPYTTDDDDVVLQNLIDVIRSVMMKSNSSSSLTLTPAQRLFNSLDLVQKKVTQQLQRIKETPTFQMGAPRHQWCCRGTDLTPAYIFEEVGICFKHLTSNHAILTVYPALRDFNPAEYMGWFHPL